MSAYSSPEKTAAFMLHLEKNSALITKLRNVMKQPGSTTEERVLAFAELYRVMHGDHHRQRRLVVELEIEVRRAQHEAKQESKP